MAFSNFKPIGEVLKTFQVTYTEANFISEPYFILVEAKQDNFETGWAQCLAEMIAAQRLNGEYQIIIFGIVSNGATWQFCKLENDILTKNSTYYAIQELDKLFSAVNFVFQQSELQLNNLVLTPA
jgi:hypothetical protein